MSDPSTVSQILPASGVLLGIMVTRLFDVLGERRKVKLGDELLDRGERLDLYVQYAANVRSWQLSTDAIKAAAAHIAAIKAEMEKDPIDGQQGRALLAKSESMVAELTSMRATATAYQEKHIDLTTRLRLLAPPKVKDPLHQLYAGGSDEQLVSAALEDFLDACAKDLHPRRKR